MAALTQVEIARLLDPETVAGISATLPANLPRGRLTVQQVRQLDRELAIMPPETGTSRWIDRPDGSPLELRFYSPVTPDPTIARTIVLWIHGGGMFLGSARQDDALCQELCDALGIRIASVDYRLAPEHPYPEPLDDCYYALEWLAARNDRVAVIGASAGGGLAAGLALRARDQAGPSIAALQLLYPMLDDRETEGSRRLAETAVWNSRLNRLAWEAYLAGRPADEYAAPSRADDLAGLPPTYVDTGDLDLFHEEDVLFASRIAKSGGVVELCVEVGAVHAFELIAPDAKISRSAVRRRRDWLRAALE